MINRYAKVKNKSYQCKPVVKYVIFAYRYDKILHIMRKFFNLFIVAVCGIASCQQFGADEQKAFFKVDTESVEMASDKDFYCDPFQEAQAELTDTITICSSRSWTVSVKTEDGGSWVRTSVKERLNASGSMEVYPLVLTFDKYKGALDRSASLIIYAAENEDPVVIPIVQKAYTPVLEVSSLENIGVASAINGECYAIIRSNTSWTAYIDEEKSTVVPSLSMLSGEGTAALLLTFPANVDDGSARIATLVVKAAGCEDYVLEIAQSQSERYFMLDGEVASDMMPYDSKVHIPLRSNGPWTAELVDCTFEDAELQPSSGNQSLSGFNFTAAHGADPMVAEKSATIKVSRDGFEDIVITLRQKGSLHLSFCEFDPEYEFTGGNRYNDASNPYKPYKSTAYPFSVPASVPKSFSIGTLAGEEVYCVMKDGGFTFVMYGSDCGVWYDATTYGWCVGKKKDDYVIFPAIEDYRLAEMYYEASCRASNPYSVRTEDGLRVIKGGEASFTKLVSPIDSNHHDMHVHIFPDTEPGVRYRLNLDEDYRMISIKDLCLVYEKVN